MSASTAQPARIRGIAELPLAVVARAIRTAPALALGAILVGFCIGLAVASFGVHDLAYQNNLVERLQPPAWFSGGGGHILGTDSLGRDVLARIMTGIRISLMIGVSSVAIAGIVGVAVGMIAAYLGGWIDDIMMRITDAVLAIPLVLLAISVVAVLGPGITNLIGIIAFTQWMVYARTARAETLVLKEQAFVAAARSIGARDWWILVRHVLPHLIPSAIVLATLNISSVVLLEAGLSYLGLGVQLPNPSLGSMLTEGQQYIFRAPWLAIFPGLALVILVMGVNLLGEGIRARLDPYHRPTVEKPL